MGRAVSRTLPFLRGLLLLVAAAAFTGIVRPSLVRGQTGEPASAARLVLVADLTGAIGPASANFIDRAIAMANERHAEMLVLRINTPGGLVTSMREMISAIIGSQVPVIGYVAPSGAHAASAGTYILYATHVAAMAPGTNIGAATPIELGGLPGLPSPSPSGGEKNEKKEPQKNGGGEPQKTLTPSEAPNAKAVNDAVALIRSLAELRGRNADWGEKAVRQAATLTASSALSEHVIEIIAPDMDALLKALNGRQVKIGNSERTLSTTNVRIARLEPGIVSKLLAIITDPNIALILMMIGVYGLIFEFINPGSFAPGTIGTICLIIGLYSLNQLPLDYAGLALILFGVALMTAEAFIASFGVLGIGGIAAFVIGAAMLVDTDIPAYQISWNVIAGMAIASAALLILMLGYVWRAQRKPIRTGRDRLRGATAEVLDWSGNEGHVWAVGERWRATSSEQFSEGDQVCVHKLDGLTLLVGRDK